jgi:hypothetical protein
MIASFRFDQSVRTRETLIESVDKRSTDAATSAAVEQHWRFLSPHSKPTIDWT